MGKESNEWWIEGELSSEDMGEMVKSIREDHLQISQEAVCEKISVKLDTLQKSETGKGAHVGNVLSRICKAYGLKTVLQIKAN